MRSEITKQHEQHEDDQEGAFDKVVATVSIVALTSLCAN